jgi:ribosomal protein L16 Arg81 hydroxylase
MLKTKLLKQYDLNCPSWETLLDNLNNSVINGDDVKHNCLSFFFSDNAKIIPEVKNILNKLNLRLAHLYVNITQKGDTYGRHSDTVDVYYWQVQGKTSWEFDDEKYILEPGDLIIIPKGVYHNVQPLSPRAGISMSI